MRRGRWHSWRRLHLAGAVLLLAGCSSEVTTPGEALRIVGAGLPPAYVGVDYEEPIHAVGGLRPYDFSIVDGVLPAGLSLLGGTLRGTPTATGSATFTVQVSDANLSKTVQQFTLQVSEIPPPNLTVSAPLTQVQRRITLRGKVLGARDLRGLSTLIGWDAEVFQLVEGSVRASRSSLGLLFEAGEGRLQIDVVPLGTVLDGDVELFQFELEPLTEPNYLQVDLSTLFASALGRTFAAGSEGRPATAPPAIDEPTGEPADAPEEPGGPNQPGVPDVPGPPDLPGLPGEDGSE